MSIIQKESTLTCPHCGYKKAEIMPRITAKSSTSAKDVGKS